MPPEQGTMAFDAFNEVNAISDAASNMARAVRACTNCVRAKAKCLPNANAMGKCERCFSMKKDCQASPPMRRRRKGTKQSVGKVEKLEEKVNGLVALLKTTSADPSGAFSAAPVNSAIENQNLVTSGRDLSSRSSAMDGIYYDPKEGAYTDRGLPRSVLTPPTSSSSGSALTSPPSVANACIEPGPEDAESYLDRFRNNFIQYLPFIVISSSMTAHQLRQESPILWLCIMTVASTRSLQQEALSKEARAVFGREAYVEGTRNMDLLLAVLVYATWDRRYCFDKPILTSLVQLAVAVLYDMGLDKPPSNDSGLINEYDLKGVQRPSRYSRSPTSEERRALLGCFLLSSVPSFAKKGETLRWTLYCDACVQILAEQQEHPSDELLVRLVKLRLVADRAMDLPWSSGNSCTARSSTTHYLQSMQAQLHDLKSSLTSGPMQNKILLLELHSTELGVNEVGMSQAPDIFVGKINQRFECLFACLQALKSWIDVFLSIPPAEYVGFSVCIYAKMARCLVGLWRLSTCEHPEWDRSLVRTTLDVSLILEETERNFGQVKAAASLDPGLPPGADAFSIMASRLRSMKASWDAMVTATTAPFGSPSFDDLVDLSTEFSDVWNW